MIYRSPHACIFALQLVREQYGELSERVCGCLIKRGAQTLMELARGVGLPGSQLREALLLLIQHNCVNAYLQVNEATLRSAESSQCVYEAAPAAILQSLRKPRFLVYIRDQGGELAEMIIESLLEHGRLRMEQLVAQAAAKQAQGSAEEVRSEVTGKMMSLVQSRFVERAPPASLPLPLKAPITAKTKSKTAQAEQDNVAAQRLAPHAKYDKDRFRLPIDMFEYQDTGTVQEPSAGRKRTFSEAENEEDNSVATILWRVNTDEFNRRFRHARCVELVKEKMDAQSAVVVECMLAVGRLSETSVDQAQSRTMTVTEVSSQMEKRQRESPDPEVATINAPSLLRDMCQDPLEFVMFVGDTAYGANYCVNMERMLDVIKLKETECVIRERFGVVALRIFRLLFQRHQLEQKQIADMVMSPIKDTRELLYKLLQAGYVSMQEIAKTQDHAPTRTFYLWRVDYDQSTTRLAAELYKAAANIRTRNAAELIKEKDVLEMLDNNPEGLTQKHRSRLERIKQLTEVMDASLLRLDELIAVFNDY